MNYLLGKQFFFNKKENLFFNDNIFILYVKQHVLRRKMLYQNFLFYKINSYFYGCNLRA